MTARAILLGARNLCYTAHLDRHVLASEDVRVHVYAMHRSIAGQLTAALEDHYGHHLELSMEGNSYVLRRDFYVLTRDQFNALDVALREQESHNIFSYERGCREGRREALATTGEHFGWKGE